MLKKIVICLLKEKCNKTSRYFIVVQGNDPTHPLPKQQHTYSPHLNPQRVLILAPEEEN